MSSLDYLQMTDETAAHTPGAKNRHVQSVLQQAERELRKLIDERAGVTKRIGTLKQTIVGLAKLFGDGILDPALLDMVDCKGPSRKPGITQACRRVLIDAGRPMSAREICDEIQRTIPALLAYHKDPTVTINTILRRLVEYGEATALRGNRGQRVWLWASECSVRSGDAPNVDGRDPTV